MKRSIRNVFTFRTLYIWSFFGLISLSPDIDHFIQKLAARVNWLETPPDKFLHTPLAMGAWCVLGLVVAPLFGLLFVKRNLPTRTSVADDSELV